MKKIRNFSLVVLSLMALVMTSCGEIENRMSLRKQIEGSWKTHVSDDEGFLDILYAFDDDGYMLISKYGYHYDPYYPRFDHWDGNYTLSGDLKTGATLKYSLTSTIDPTNKLSEKVKAVLSDNNKVLTLYYSDGEVVTLNKWEEDE